MNSSNQEGMRNLMIPPSIPLVQVGMTPFSRYSNSFHSVLTPLMASPFFGIQIHSGKVVGVSGNAKTDPVLTTKRRQLWIGVWNL